MDPRRFQLNGPTCLIPCISVIDFLCLGKHEAFMEHDVIGPVVRKMMAQRLGLPGALVLVPSTQATVDVAWELAEAYPLDPNRFCAAASNYLKDRGQAGGRSRRQTTGWSHNLDALVVEEVKRRLKELDIPLQCQRPLAIEELFRLFYGLECRKFAEAALSPIEQDPHTEGDQVDAHGQAIAAVEWLGQHVPVDTSAIGTRRLMPKAKELGVNLHGTGSNYDWWRIAFDVMAIGQSSPSI